MINTAEELIKRLQTEYRPDEQLAYTIYSEGDVKDEETWDDVIDEFNGSFDYVQQILNETLTEMGA